MKLKTRRHREKTEQCVWYIYSIVESVYLVLNSLWDWEPVDRFKKRKDMVMFKLLLLLFA